MNKRILLCIIACLMSVALVGCSTKAQGNVKGEQEVKQEEKIDNKDKKLLEKILITYKVDSIADDKQIMQVSIKNTTDKTFTGDIHIYFEDKEGKEIGYDMAIVESLKAGNTTICNIKAKVIKEEDVKIDYNFSDKFSFTDDNITEGTLNKELSNKISKSMKESFGNEHFTADWYPSITNIEVYETDNEKYIVATVTDDGEKIGNILFGNFAYGEDKISKIIIKDKEDNVLFTKTK